MASASDSATNTSRYLLSSTTAESCPTRSSAVSIAVLLMPYHAGIRWPHHSWRETHHGWMFSSQLNQVLAQVSGTILISPFLTAWSAGSASLAASTYHWSVSHGSIVTPERSPNGVGMTRSSTRTKVPSS